MPNFFDLEGARFSTETKINQHGWISLVFFSHTQTPLLAMCVREIEMRQEEGG